MRHRRTYVLNKQSKKLLINYDKIKVKKFIFFLKSLDQKSSKIDPKKKSFTNRVRDIEGRQGPTSCPLLYEGYI